MLRLSGRVSGGIFATGSSSSNMAVTSRLLFVAQAARRLQRASHPGKVDLLAFYSSVLGGIVRDPGLMAVHIDDHMVHRWVVACKPNCF